MSDEQIVECMFIPGVPGAKGRPRFTRQGRAYTPAKTAKYETYLKNHMATHMQDAGATPFKGPVEIRLGFGMPEPKSMPKRDRGRDMPHVKRPDLDNLVKAVLDAANGVLVQDDSSICSIEAVKRYSSDRVGVSIEICEVRITEQ